MAIVIRKTSIGIYPIIFFVGFLLSPCIDCKFNGNLLKVYPDKSWGHNM